MGPAQPTGALATHQGAVAATCLPSAAKRVRALPLGPEDRPEQMGGLLQQWEAALGAAGTLTVLPCDVAAEEGWQRSTQTLKLWARGRRAR